MLRNSKEGQCGAWGARKYVARESVARETSMLSHVPCFLARYGYFSSTGWKVFFFLVSLHEGHTFFPSPVLPIRALGGF